MTLRRAADNIAEVPDGETASHLLGVIAQMLDLG